MKIVFTMLPESGREPFLDRRFDFEACEQIEDRPGTVALEAPVWLKRFSPRFYIPKPVAKDAKRIRVTIEELL